MEREKYEWKRTPREPWKLHILLSLQGPLNVCISIDEFALVPGVVLIPLRIATKLSMTK